MSDAMERLKSALADRYTIERELGEGGMATVYLAEDIKHHRKVAIKLLKPELAAVLGAERFVQEITTTAALQHPHILPLFDSGEADGFLYYVMPFVDGETLRDKLNRETQFGIDEAVKITTEIADALHYAHSQGVVHRDIKPENILLANGRPMVADFGIALAVSAAAGGRMTETGLSLGTPHYMSPEQATAEKEITARSDVYSLGSMLYEMLAGEPPHLGGSAQQIIMKIIAEDPQPLTVLRKSVPQNVAAAVAKSLEKLPADRFQSAEEFGKALVDPGFTTQTAGGAASLAIAGQHGSRLVIGLGVVALLATIGAAWGWLRSTPVPEPSRFAVEFPESRLLNANSVGTSITVSRDGRTLVYVSSDSSGVPRLWQKQDDELEARAITGTENAYGPFLSPDGTQVGFFREGGTRTLNLVTLAGGSPRVLYDGLLGTSGADWATDGFIYFDTDRFGLQRIRPDGNDQEEVLTLDSSKDEIGFAWPQVIPGNEVIIARIRRSGDGPSDFEIAASLIGTNEWTPVVRGVSARFVEGQLIYVTADGTLQAADFDHKSLELTGPATLLATGVRVAGPYAGVNLTTSTLGTLYFVSGPAGLESHLEWIHPDGTTSRADPSWRSDGLIGNLALSPDGRSVAMEIAGFGNSGEVWVKELPIGPITRLTMSESEFNGFPAWSGDGQSVLFSAQSGEGMEIRRRRADGLGEDSLVIRSGGGLIGVNESTDGRWIVGTRRADTVSGSMDIVVLEIGVDSLPRELIATGLEEHSARISPDGRWITYVSNSSGRLEVYVRPFPSVNDGIWQLSLNGGRSPRWSRSGNTVYFRSATADQLYAVDVSTTPEFSRGTPRLVASMSATSGLTFFAGYDVGLEDGQFLVVGRGSADESSSLVRIDNVLEDIRRRRVQ